MIKSMLQRFGWMKCEVSDLGPLLSQRCEQQGKEPENITKIIWLAEIFEGRELLLAICMSLILNIVIFWFLNDCSMTIMLWAFNNGKN